MWGIYCGSGPTSCDVAASYSIKVNPFFTIAARGLAGVIRADVIAQNSEITTGSTGIQFIAFITRDHIACPRGPAAKCNATSA